MNKPTGLPVAGYSPQSEEATAVVNGQKLLEELVLRWIDGAAGDPSLDQRWVSIARIHIQEGFMALNRAVFKPKRISGEIHVPVNYWGDST